MKTRKRPPEIVSKPAKISAEAGYLLVGRYRLQSQSIACIATLDVDFCCQMAAVFSHILGREQPIRKGEPYRHNRIRELPVWVRFETFAWRFPNRRLAAQSRPLSPRTYPRGRPALQLRLHRNFLSWAHLYEGMALD